MVAQQADGHSDVFLKNMPCPEGSVVAMVPNGQLVTVVADRGDYVKVCWGQASGYARKANLVQVAPTQETFQFIDTNGEAITLIQNGHVVNVHTSSVGKVGIWEGFDLVACWKRWVCQSKKWSVFACQSKKRPYTPGLVRMVKSHLKAKGYTTFFDVDALVSICKQELEAAIASSNIFLLFLDDKTLDSEWCEFEVLAAVRLKVPIHVVFDVDHHHVEDLISYWRDCKRKHASRYLFGSSSHQLIAHSVKHEALHDDAMLQIEQRINMEQSKGTRN